MSGDKPFKICGPDKTFASSSGCSYYDLAFLMYCVERFWPNDLGVLHCAFKTKDIAHCQFKILKLMMHISNKRK